MFFVANLQNSFSITKQSCTISFCLNHSKSHTSFLAQSAFVGYLHEFFGKVKFELVAVATHTGFVGGASLDADESRFGFVEQLEVAVRSAAEWMPVDGVVAVEQTCEDAQFVAWVGGREVVHVTSFVAEGNADGREGSVSHVGMVVEGRHHLYLSDHELNA